MTKYDITFKEIFSGTGIPETLIEIITGSKIIEVLQSEFNKVKKLMVDLLAKLEDNTILHLEFQSTNDPNMNRRMYQYYTVIEDEYPHYSIRQVVLYVGNKKMNMPTVLKKDRLIYEYELIDIRDIDCKKLIESENEGDRIVSVLCKIEDEQRFIDGIWEYVLKLREDERATFLKKVFLLSHLRPQINVVLKRTFQEAKKMPIRIDTEDLKGTWFYEIGWKEGREEKEQEDVVNLYLETHWTPEKISKVLKIPLNRVEKYLKKAKLLDKG